MNYGRYEIVKELGKGAMGVVYHAHDPNIGREIALKVLRADRMGSEDFVQRFLKEAKAIGRMSHQNIVTVYDVGEDQGTVFIAMELLDGVPLNTYAREKSLTIEEIADIGIQLAGSLDYAHSRGIVHRDIKPQNIMAAPGGVVKLTDFGIAHIEDPEASHQTQVGEIMGTPNYMSPEQVMGQKADGRSDLYSLGVILYELATGVKPFKGENLAAIFHAIMSETPARPEALNPSVPTGFSDILMKCLAKKPAERYGTGQELVDALRAFVRSTEPAIAGQKETKKGPLAMVMAAVLVLAVIAVGAFFFMTSHKQAPVEMGAFKVESLPTGAQVFIDGTFKGKSPLTIDLPVGGHEVRMSMPEYYEWEAQVQVEKKQGPPLKIDLVPVEKGSQ